MADIETQLTLIHSATKQVCSKLKDKDREQVEAIVNAYEKLITTIRPQKKKKEAKEDKEAKEEKEVKEVKDKPKKRKVDEDKE
jgi:hypothetical protein